jgi:NhaA family Na+:H+ antiporter
VATRRLRAAFAPLRQFLGTEAAGGVLLAAASLVALAWANSPWGDGYRRLWAHRLEAGPLDLDIRRWINDALMTVFFLVVGLEIKRELTSGHLAHKKAAMLPLVAAIGGMAVPALLYAAIAGAGQRHGWGVPMATDIALAVGVVAIAGDRVPPALRAFLLGLAIVDDIGAIVVIAIFYSGRVGFGWLALAAAAFAAAAIFRLGGISNVWLYVPAGAAMWFCLHEAGIHPTLAGVSMGLLAPSAADDRDADTDDPSGSVVERVESLVHPLSSFLVVPLFALANSGIELSAHGLVESAGRSLTWAILVGLVVGKPLGVWLGSRAAVAAGLATPLQGARGARLGVGYAAGIGFTVAIFVAELAFSDPVQQDDAKLAILGASVASAALALAMFVASGRGQVEPLPDSN